MKFFITGATGFIGSHLTKTLLERGEAVTVLLNKSAALEEFAQQSPEKFASVKVDLLDPEAMAEVLAGQDVVIHLAYGSRGTPEEQRRITIEGTQSVLRAATKANVKRFIYMSSASVYGEPPKDRTYTENDPRYASLELYPSLKQEAELAALKVPSSSIEVVVLQPSIIYGPGKGYWTEGILKALKKGSFPLVNGGSGLCNLIHLYDVVEAIILAASVPDIQGECFILANDEPFTWKIFLESYEAMLGKKCLINLPTWIMKKYNVWYKYQRKIPEYKLYAKVLKVLVNLFQSQSIRKPVRFPANERIDFFAAKPKFSNQKAKDRLGFTPKMTFEAGMQTIKQWVDSTR